MRYIDSQNADAIVDVQVYTPTNTPTMGVFSLHTSSQHELPLVFVISIVIETFCNVESQSHFDIHFPLVSAFVSGVSPLCSGLLTGASPAPSSRNFLLIASMAFQISCGLDCVNGEFGTRDLSLFNYSLHFQPCIGGHI